jgi:hypothetical protein
MGWLNIATKFFATNLHGLQTATLSRFELCATLSKVADEFLQVACEFLRCRQRGSKSGSLVQDFGIATEFLFSKNGLNHPDTATKR